MIAMVLYYSGMDFIVNYLGDKVEVLEDISLLDNYSKCIVCDNDGVSRAYAFQIVSLCIEKCPDIMCYYFFSEDEKKQLRELAYKKGVNIEFLTTQFDGILDLKKFDIPVIYICGEGADCDQIEYHVMFANWLQKRGFSVLNISNSIKASLLGFEYLDIDRILGEARSKEILKINEWLIDLQKKYNADVIILSNEEGIIPLNSDDTTSFGIQNHFLKYAIPFDYVVFSVYTNLIDEMNINAFCEYLGPVVNEKDICVAVSKHCYDKTNGYISIFQVTEDEYMSCWNRVNMKGNIIALCENNSVECFLERIVGINDRL